MCVHWTGSTLTSSNTIKVTGAMLAIALSHTPVFMRFPLATIVVCETVYMCLRTVGVMC